MAPTIVIVEEARQPVVAALLDVLRDAGEVEAGKSCHGHKHPDVCCPHLSALAK